ncbi:MAG: cell division protein FtsL [Candidatus Aminicenantes bacterium]|nr:cell division protein FtsL [Candidatus Aminicenantes bacterium]
MVHKKFTFRQVALASAAGLVLIFILCFYLWQITETVRLGYEAGKAENAKRTLEKDVHRLEAEKAALLALDRVERTAREKLGLADPREDQVVYEDVR